ncbi:glucan biosynthesis protein, partial [Escherichia coli]|uniref:glucan biosynthesis protein n=1 Tax=Escherichia coli TaxID=562 RepID=UPI003DA2FDB8
MGTVGIASLFLQAVFAADSDIADGQTQRFAFSILQSMAYDLAQTAWSATPRPLPDTLATMTRQAYNSIYYIAEKTLWHNVDNRKLDAPFFHMGKRLRRRGRLFSGDPTTHLAREIHCSPAYFKYKNTAAGHRRFD